jgi:hypothetical protein
MKGTVHEDIHMFLRTEVTAWGISASRYIMWGILRYNVITQTGARHGVHSKVA